MFRRGLIILIVLFSASGIVHGQDVKVTGRFHRDSVRIGEELPFSLTVRYPSALNVILPDTAFSFAPFEFSKKKYFPTVTTGDISYDSVVYFLTTFEIDSVQTLRLPAYVIHARDCTEVFSNTDSVLLNQMVRAKYDSLEAKALPLKTNTDYLNVSWLLNYPLLLIIAGILLLAAAAVWIIFGKRIIRYYKLKRMTRRHEAFVRQYADSVRQLNENFSSSGAESLFVLWKKYMENLVSRPYTKYTAREIQRLEKDEMLSEALGTINRIIYAGIRPSSEDVFTKLRSYTDAQFLRKTQEVKHG